ncbi:acly protein [Salpingoeca rosetta]|uniref:ATP-citrate synthase n=1 Tax=Salpingoeca rosetta (strain ATCC 50818 / BSB-021) TaxID=946362 RepID=F2UL87_SALR5|nr:acly protein [Salpingoeca rosetta]EGD77886.1 acly protein [Salpingoeca rosetta]|eukprot:XP_004989950.1 acly protein [Salpingoeca rosetta]
MSAKAIREVDGKRLLAEFLPADCPGKKNIAIAAFGPGDSWERLAENHPFLTQKTLVAKPDQLIKRRGKLGLVKVKVDFEGAKTWVNEKMNSTLQIGSATGTLKHFVLEPFVAHEQSDEHYCCIYAGRDFNTILFHHEGGVDIGDVDAKAARMEVQLDTKPTPDQIRESLLTHLDASRQQVVADFLSQLYALFIDLHFTYMEINPIVVKDNEVYILDLAAKLDQTAEYLCHNKWGAITFPPPFGRDALPEEAYIAELDAKSGASLKLTILNPRGRIWTMVAGGGASVVYSDTICDLGGASELANYGEYSGAPSESQTFEYAKTILSLMTREAHPDGKVLIIGGGIANFTNVASTFKGIIRALDEYHGILHEQKVKIFVRRGGPNFQEGLKCMRDAGERLGLDIHVYGPELHMTSIVAMALGLKKPDPTTLEESFMTNLMATTSDSTTPAQQPAVHAPPKSVQAEPTKGSDYKPLFTNKTRALFFGMQPRACQGMLDFDYCCKREKGSVAGMIYPFSGNHSQKFYWGTKEVLIPVYQKMEEAMAKNPDVDVLINFASLRSAYDSTLAALQFPQIKVIAIIAEGIPEHLTRLLIKEANARGVTIIGPATVGGIKPGCFKIGNTGGMIDNIISAKLYRPGSVAYVSRSGGMSNELNNIISRNSNGVYEGVAIGGDRYPGSTFMDHLLRYQDDPDAKVLVLLGEVGGIEEYAICEALKSSRINKPLIAWCIGTCAKMFSSDVQFGHAGASAHSDRETALAKNKALREAGALVPESFDTLGELIHKTYSELVASGVILVKPEPAPPKVPIDYKWAAELGLIRKSANFVSSISDERGEELLYAGMPITAVFKENIGIGGVISLLWFQRRLPDYACKFIEMALMVTADHGPAVSGAHNTIVAARAGKDLVSSLCSGLLTIGDRFGGALDGAARMFSEAYDAGLSPRDFVDSMRRQHRLIMGIGHKVKSLTNPDMRVVIMKEFVQEHFPKTPLLDYALEVEKITTAKKTNLILNVDGVIAVAFVDLLRECGAFTMEEANDYIQMGGLNALFVLGRTTGFIGHYLDQRRLKQGLYRHPWDDIAYLSRPQDGSQ